MTRSLIIEEIEKILTSKTKTRKLVHLLQGLDKKSSNLLESLIAERTNYYHNNIQDIKAFENYANLTLIRPLFTKILTKRDRVSTLG